MLNTLALGIILIAIVLACTDLLRPSRRLSLAISSTADPGSKGARRTTPGVAVDLSRNVPIVLHGFDPRQEALVVQLPRMIRPEEEEASFAVRPGPGSHGRGLEILFLDRVLVRLPEVPSDSDVELYLETLAA